ncbi:MAG: LysM peptidoglycan-binding domain-containing protein [Verrucomicrobiota bacterium]
MKLPQLLPRKKLRATIARRSLGLPDEMDFEEMSEPNMKLSRALLIVLVLHIVAVAGIVAFNTIKTRQGPLPPPPAAMVTEPVATKVESAPALKNDAKPAHAPNKSIAKTAEPIPAKAETARTYVVAKGDNPVAIAKKYKIPYDDLLAANHIDDPHKLQIGQKLVIPTKAARPKKTE